MFYRTLYKIGLCKFFELIGDGDDHVGKKECVWPACFGALLCFLHFGCRHHLHGTGYLTGIFYAFYPYSDVSGVCHFS